MNKKLQMLMLLGASFSLLACGGGSGNSTPPPTYSISAKVSGLSAGVELIVVDSQGIENSIFDDGDTYPLQSDLQSGESFSFSLKEQPEDKNCLIDQFAGVISNADVELSISCQAEGDLDARFAGNGELTISQLQPIDMLSTSGGDIFVLGDGTDSVDAGIYLSKINADGSINTDFATDGALSEKTTDFDDVEELKAVKVLIDSKDRIVVVARIYKGVAKTAHPAIFRYNADGSRDTTFGSGGFVLGEVITGSTKELGLVGSAVIDTDDGIYISGNSENIGNRDNSNSDVFPEVYATVWKYGAEGRLDTSFAGNGVFVDSYLGHITRRSVIGSQIVLSSKGGIVFPYREGVLALNALGLLDEDIGVNGYSDIVSGSGAWRNVTMLINTQDELFFSLNGGIPTCFLFMFKSKDNGEKDQSFGSGVFSGRHDGFEGVLGSCENNSLILSNNEESLYRLGREIRTGEDSQIRLSKFTADKAKVGTSFGENGEIKISLLEGDQASFSSINAPIATLGADGSILISGYKVPNDSSSGEGVAFLRKYHP